LKVSKNIIIISLKDNIGFAGGVNRGILIAGTCPNY
jgi:GT2 family glycosyltransferase